MDAIQKCLATHGCSILLERSSCRKYCLTLENKLLPRPSTSNSRSWVAAATLDKGRRHRQLRASPGEVPIETTEESKFVPLNAEDPIYGPPALLLVGFDADEISKIYKLLKDLDGEFLKIIHFTKDMISLTVWDAMHVEQKDVSIPKRIESLPRICIFSGLSGEEMMMFIDAFPEAGLEQAIFAAMVPNSAGKLLGEVIDEIIGDHEMMSAKQSV